MHSSAARWLGQRLGFRVKLSRADDKIEHEGLVEKEDETLEFAYRSLQRRYRRLKYTVSVITILSMVGIMLVYVLDQRKSPPRRKSGSFVPERQ